LVLLDEPSMGLAPQLKEEIFDIVTRRNTEQDMTFVLAEQDTNVALRHAHYGDILENSSIVMDGTAEALAQLGPAALRFARTA